MGRGGSVSGQTAAWPLRGAGYPPGRRPVQQPYSFLPLGAVDQ